MFSFFREFVMFNSSNGAVSVDSSMRSGSSDSRFLSLVENDPISLIIINNLVGDSIRDSRKSSIHRDYGAEDNFFIDVTCPEYMLPFMVGLTVSYASDFQRFDLISIFEHEDTGDDSNSGLYVKQNIFDFNIAEIDRTKNSFSTSELLKMRNEFSSLLPATIRPSLSNFVLNLFFESSEISDKRHQISFDRFFQRLAIFTVLNEFQAFKSDSGSPVTLGDFIAREGMLKSLNDRFHTGNHTVHGETINLIYAIFGLPAERYSTTSMDNMIWEYFIISICTRIASENSSNDFITNNFGNTRSLPKIVSESFINTKQSDISLMINNIDGGKKKNDDKQNGTNHQLVYEVAEAIYGSTRSLESLENIYLTQIQANLRGQELFNLKTIDTITKHQGFLTVKKTSIAKLRRQFSSYADPQHLINYVVLFNGLIHIHESLNLPNFDFETLTPTKEEEQKHNDFQDMVETIFESDLLDFQKYNVHYLAERIKSFTQIYLEHNENMQLPLILNLSGITMTESEMTV